MKDARGHGSDPGNARAETVAKFQRVDETHYPTRSISDINAMASLAQGHPKSVPVPLGQSFSTTQTALWKGRAGVR